jgi:hypothetical protein
LKTARAKVLGLCCLTLELSGRQRYDARARAEKMDGVPQPGPWWHAVGAPLERLVRPHPLVYGRTRRYSASWHAAWTPRSALPAVAWQDFKPPCLSRCRKGQCLPRRPNELAKHHSCLRSAVLRFSKVAPSNCLRASWHCLPAVTCLLFTLSLFLTSTRLGPTVLCVVAGRTGLSRLLRSPREALTLLVHRTARLGL